MCSVSLLIYYYLTIYKFHIIINKEVFLLPGQRTHRNNCVCGLEQLLVSTSVSRFVPLPSVSKMVMGCWMDCLSFLAFFQELTRWVVFNFFLQKVIVDQSIKINNHFCWWGLRFRLSLRGILGDFSPASVEAELRLPNLHSPSGHYPHTSFPSIPTCSVIYI